MKKTTALTVTVLAIATLAGTSVAQSAYSKAQAPTASVAQAESSWENSKLVHTLPTVANYAKFSSNGLLLVCNGERGKAIQFWDVTKGELLFNTQNRQSWELNGFDVNSGASTPLFSPDGQMLAVPTGRGIPIWRAFGN
jgi:WD40 repeat protein